MTLLLLTALPGVGAEGNEMSTADLKFIIVLLIMSAIPNLLVILSLLNHVIKFERLLTRLKAFNADRFDKSTQTR